MTAVTSRLCPKCTKVKKVEAGMFLKACEHGMVTPVIRLVSSNPDPRPDGTYFELGPEKPKKPGPK